jgi:hypothetical protein
MHINRRTAIRQLFIISAGAAILPACVNDKKPGASAFSNLPITTKDEAMLEALASTIIPTTDTPGAKEVAAHRFALRMVNDLGKKEQREQFVKGLKQFQDKVQQQYGKAYEKCTAQEQEKIVAAAIAAKDAGDDAAFFFDTFKHLTIQAFTSSEYYLSKVEVYKLVPGKYISSVKV